MMTTASLFSFFSAPSTVQGIRSVFKKKTVAAARRNDPLKDIELPMWISLVGVPVMTVVIAIMAKEFFDIEYWQAVLAIPVVFILSIMAVKSTGLTGITPGGSLAKMTQVVYAVAAPGNTGTNLIAAGIASEVCLNASNLLMDIKPAYMLGGKPRHQAAGHAIGIFVGSLAAVPIFYLLFQGNISVFGTEKFPMPSATVWKAVAEVLANGISSLHPTAQVAVLVGAVLGIVLELLIKLTNGKFPLSPVGMGLPFVISFTDIFVIVLGAFLFWLLEQKPKERRSSFYADFVDNRESIGAGMIAGGSIVGIAILLLETI